MQCHHVGSRAYVAALGRMRLQTQVSLQGMVYASAINARGKKKNPDEDSINNSKTQQQQHQYSVDILTHCSSERRLRCSPSGPPSAILMKNRPETDEVDDWQEVLTAGEKRWRRLWKRAKKVRRLILLGGLLMNYAKLFSSDFKDGLKKALTE